MGRLTTHVLDTARGRPGAGIALRVFALEQDTRRMVAEALTNTDGRCDEPLLEGDAFHGGEYEIVFDVGDYFAAPAGPDDPVGSSASVVDANAPRFLERATVRFNVASPEEHYHVPLLISPFAYSTYRGS